MKYLIVIFSFLTLSLSAQRLGGFSIAVFTNPGSLPATLSNSDNSVSRMAYVKSEGKFYRWDVTNTSTNVGSWSQFTQVDRISAGSPSYTPILGDSPIAINGSGTIYTWNGSSWNTIAGGGGATNLSVNRDDNNVTVISDTGTDAILPFATQSFAGVLKSTDKVLLDSALQTISHDATLIGTGRTGAILQVDTATKIATIYDVSRTWSITGNTGTNSSTNYIGTNDAQDLRFRTNSAERVTITNAGKIGIGTSTPSGKFHILTGANPSIYSGPTGDLIALFENSNGLTSTPTRVVISSGSTLPATTSQLEFWGKGAGGSGINQAMIKANMVEGSSGGLGVSNLAFSTVNDEATPVTRMTIKPTGQIQLPSYTSTSSFSGTEAGVLAFDATGNILTIPTPSSGPSINLGNTDLTLSSDRGLDGDGHALILFNISDYTALSANSTLFATNNVDIVAGNRLFLDVPNNFVVRSPNMLHEGDNFRLLGTYLGTRPKIILDGNGYTTEIQQSSLQAANTRFIIPPDNGAEGKVLEIHSDSTTTWSYVDSTNVADGSIAKSDLSAEIWGLLTSGGGTDTNWSNSNNTADDDYSQNGGGHNLLLDNYNDLGFVSNSLLQTTSGQIYSYAGSNLTMQSVGYTALESAGLTQIGADSVVINGEVGSVSKLKLNNNLGASYMIQPPTTGSGSHVLVLPPEDGTVGQAVGISSISSNVVQLGYLTAGSSVTTTREDGVITSTSSTTWNPLTANTDRMLDATVNNGFTYTVNLGQAINCQNCEISFSNWNAGITGTGVMFIDGFGSELVGSGGTFTIGAGLGASFKSVNTSGATWEWRRKF